MSRWMRQYPDAPFILREKKETFLGHANFLILLLGTKYASKGNTEGHQDNRIQTHWLWLENLSDNEQTLDQPGLLKAEGETITCKALK